MDDPDAFAGDAYSLGDPERVIIHQDDIRRLDRCVRAEGPHRDPDIRPGKNRRVINTVPDKGKTSSSGSLCVLRQQRLYLFNFLLRQKACMIFIDSEVTSYVGRDLLGVAGEHDRPGDTRPSEFADRVSRVRFDFICDQDMSQILSVSGNMDDSTCLRL